MARVAKTVTPCSPPACWKSSAPTFASCAPALPGYFPPGVRICIWPPAPCKPPATKPGSVAASPNALPPTCSATPLPPTCWSPASTPASSRRCSVIPASIPPPATPPSRRSPSAKPPVRWTCCSSPAAPNPPSVSQPNADAHANPGVGRYLSTIRPGLPAGPLDAPASPQGHAGHRRLPYYDVGRCGRMVRPMSIHSHPVSLLPRPPLPQVPGRGTRPVVSTTHRRVVAHRILSRGLHSARVPRRHCLLQPTDRLRHALPHRRRYPAHRYRRPPTPRGGNRVLQHAPHLGPEPALPSPPALCRPRRRVVPGP